MDLTTIHHIPSDPGIYLFKNKKGTILYIGKAKNLHKRVAQYFSPNSVWKQDMLSKADQIDFLVVKNESEALYLEDNLIKKHKPVYNNLLKADNSYAYIKITKEDFPQIFLTRKKPNDGSTYIGPKHNTIHLKKFLQYLRQVLKFRGCKANQFKQGKLCSDYYFGICKGRCKMSPGAESKGISFDKLKMTTHPEQSTSKEYKKIVRLIISFFKGNTLLVEKEIKSLIQKAVAEESFEWAAKLRDIYFHIEQLTEQQTVVVPKPITGYIVKIKPIGGFLVYVIINFYEGKIIDVVRGKENMEDTDLHSLIVNIENEVDVKGVNWVNGVSGKLSSLSFTKLTQLTEILGISSSIGKLSKSVLGEIDALIENFFDSYIISTSFDQENLNNDLLTQLQSRYHLKQFPYRVECVDISHLSGGWASGGLSCFIEGLKNPKGYRRYKIGQKSIKPVKSVKSDLKALGPSDLTTNFDDYAALQEVITRRIKASKLPDLLIIDGGKGQLGIVKKLYQNEKFKKMLQYVDIISLGKGEARKKGKIGQITRRGDDGSRLGVGQVIGEKIYYFDDQMKIKSENLVYDQADKILTKARDEAHRFANKYRETQMKNEFR